MNVAKFICTDHRESSDNYRGVLFQHGNLRVAECRDGLQWLIQRRRPAKAGGRAKWDTLGYCVTRKALIRLHRHYFGASAPELGNLPGTFNRGRRS